MSWSASNGLNGSVFVKSNEFSFFTPTDFEMICIWNLCNIAHFPFVLLRYQIQMKTFVFDWGSWTFLSFNCGLVIYPDISASCMTTVESGKIDWSGWDLIRSIFWHNCKGRFWCGPGLEVELRPWVEPINFAFGRHCDRKWE